MPASRATIPRRSSSPWDSSATPSCRYSLRHERESRMSAPLIGVVMGSDSDWSVMQHAAARLVEFNVPYETRIVSAHRTPDLLFTYAAEAEERGLRCIIAGAGGAAHLPGM